MPPDENAGLPLRQSPLGNRATERRRKLQPRPCRQDLNKHEPVASGRLDHCERRFAARRMKCAVEFGEVSRSSRWRARARCLDMVWFRGLGGRDVLCSNPATLPPPWLRQPAATPPTSMAQHESSSSASRPSRHAGTLAPGTCRLDAAVARCTAPVGVPARLPERLSTPQVAYIEVGYDPRGDASGLTSASSAWKFPARGTGPRSVKVTSIL